MPLRDTPEAAEARENGYIECSECGHTLEQHIERCNIDGCACPARWRRGEVEHLRRCYGLPGGWRF